MEDKNLPERKPFAFSEVARPPGGVRLGAEVKRPFSICAFLLGAISLGLVLYYSTGERQAERLVRKSQDVATAVTASMTAFHTQPTIGNVEQFSRTALQLRRVISHRRYPPNLRASMEYELREAVHTVLAMSSNQDPTLKSAVWTRLQPLLSNSK